MAIATADYIMIDGVAHQVRDANAVPQDRTVNGKALDKNISLVLSDLGESIATNAEIDAIIDS